LKKCVSNRLEYNDLTNGNEFAILYTETNEVEFALKNEQH